MSEDELLEIIEEFETASDIKEFFEDRCKNRAIKPFDMSVLNKIKNIEPLRYTSDILVKKIFGVNNIKYDNKSPLELVNSEDNMDNALKVIINNPDYLLNDYSKKALSFILVRKNDKEYYFLNSNGNHRVLILIVLSDICEELKIIDVDVLEYNL